MKHPRNIINPRAGFTLVEILVAVALMVLVLVLLLQMTNLTSNSVSRSSRQVEATQELRLAVDVLRQDLQNAVLHDGGGLLLGEDAGGNAILAFATRARLPQGSNGRLLAVCYRVDPATGLVRYYSVIPWGEPDLMAAAENLAGGTPPGTRVSPLGPGIFRFAVRAGSDDGLWKTFSGAPGTTRDDLKLLALPQPRATEPAVPVESANRILVAFAALDNRGLQVADRGTLTSDFVLNDSLEELPFSQWNQKIGQFESLPAPVREGIRFNQEIFVLTHL